MVHYNEDRLTEYTLEMIEDDEEKQAVENHLRECGQCQERLKKIRNDIEFIGSLRPQSGKESRFPLKNRGRAIVYGLIRAAALIVFGFFIGLGVTGVSESETVCIIPCYVELEPPSVEKTNFAMSDATGLTEQYYEQLIEKAQSGG